MKNNRKTFYLSNKIDFNKNFPLSVKAAVLILTFNYRSYQSITKLIILFLIS